MLEIWNSYFVYYAISGVAVGILAGLFGVGGGIIIVPILTFIFRALGFSEEILFHCAIGTSLATILFTSFSSLLTHNRNKAVLWSYVWRLSPGIVLGAYVGSFFAANLATRELKYIFIGFIYLFATKMLIPQKKNPPGSDGEPVAPGVGVQSLVGTIIGFFSALVGIGGGVFTSSYMLALRVPIHSAIGTSAAVGFPIAVSGMLSYMYTGYGLGDLPQGSLGYVYFPALMGIVLGSVPFAYLGAKLSHRLDKNRLRKFFAIFLYCMATYMWVR